MPVGVYVYFNGNCREAVDFYSRVFSTKSPKFMAFGDAPPNPAMPMSEEAKNLIMHTELEIDGSKVMFSDVFPGSSYIAGNMISLIFNCRNLESMKVIFDQLKEGGAVEMELQATFWSQGYGFLVDKFGVGWQFNYDSGETNA